MSWIMSNVQVCIININVILSKGFLWRACRRTYLNILKAFRQAQRDKLNGILCSQMLPSDASGVLQYSSGPQHIHN